jgi:hypothetical protein
VRALLDGKVVVESRVSVAETVARGQADFTKPKRTAGLPLVGNVVVSKVGPIGAASSALGGRVAWMGRRFAGLRLSEVRLDTIKTSYGAPGNRHLRTSEGVELLYGQRGARYASLREATEPALAYGFLRGSMLPPAGRLLVRRVDVETAPREGGRAVPTGAVVWQGQLVQGRLFVALEASSKALLLKAARSVAGAGGSR